MPKPKVYRDEKGLLFHDECFEPGESREGYEVVDLNDVDRDDDCESCGGGILAGPIEDVDDDADTSDDDDEQTA